jgi:chitinase
MLMESALMGQSAKRHIGRILVDGRFLSQQDLDHVLIEQTHTKELLGRVLVRMGMLAAEDVRLPLIVQQNLGNVEGAVKLAVGERQLLGALLVQSGHITNKQLDHVIAEQQRSGEKLGEVFKRLGMLTQRQLSALLDFQHNQEVPHASPLRLGNLLVATGHISRQQLEDALHQQAVTHKKLGEVLVAAGYVSPGCIKYGIRLQKMLLNAVLAAIISLGLSTGSEASTVSLQWDPNSEPGVSGYKVCYSADPSTLEWSRPVNAHQQATATISGLDPDKAYRFAVKAYNSAGQESPFSNIVPVAELSPPTVAITSPENATSVSGTVLISVSATDNVGVTKVEFYINSQLLVTQTSAPYVYSWDTTSHAPGVYTILVKAYDAAGNVSQSCNTVINSAQDTNAPTLQAAYDIAATGSGVPSESRRNNSGGYGS